MPAKHISFPSQLLPIELQNVIVTALMIVSTTQRYPFNPAINLEETNFFTNYINASNPALFKQCILQDQVSDAPFSAWNRKKEKEKNLEISLIITYPRRKKYTIKLNM